MVIIIIIIIKHFYLTLHSAVYSLMSNVGHFIRRFYFILYLSLLCAGGHFYGSRHNRNFMTMIILSNDHFSG